MINEITITDLSKAESYAFGDKTEYNAWISAVDEEDRHRIKRMKKLFDKKEIVHFSQFFFDWSDEDDDPFINKNIETMGPQVQHVEKIISFLKTIVDSNKVYNLGINCFAGVSRSTAIGIIASVMTGKLPTMALEYILSVRPQAWPNLRILRFASDTLKQDLVTPVKQWKRSQSSHLYYR